MNNDQKIDCILEKVSSMDGKFNIMRVAEGHMDLDRKLKEVVTSRTEYEMLTLRVNHLEAAVEKLKRR